MAAVAIRDGLLYVGGQASLAQLGALGVTRVISLGAPPTAPALAQDACLCVHLVDDESADLLSQLPACVAFAQQAARDGAPLLVACHAGVSRSAAVATAVLMATQGLSCDAALAAVQAAHPGAAPNEAFREQLALFGAMGCRLQEAHAPYRRFRVSQLAAAHAAGTAQAGDAAAALSADPSTAAAAAGADEGGTVRCRKCRRLLAAAEHTVAHDRGAGAAAFDPHKRRKGAASAAGGAPAACSSVFVEPLAWMAPALADGALEGKLSCPKCDGRLGGFCWAGAQCSCGAWVVPAFQLHAARVDVTHARA